jgi:hypothetical protein
MRQTDGWIKPYAVLAGCCIARTMQALWTAHPWLKQHVQSQSVTGLIASDQDRLIAQTVQAETHRSVLRSAVTSLRPVLIGAGL